MIQYISTRGRAEKLNFADAMLAGLATDGGLYVPETFPTLSTGDLKNFQSMQYADIAYEVIKPFVEGSVDVASLKSMIDEVYGNFDASDVAPVKKIGDDLYVCELFHGPTIAFKDFALQLLGRLFDYTLKQRNEKVTIVGATSGDTGSAAIDACKNKECIDIFILHPLGRTSEVQRFQMTTVGASNVNNIAIKGTFDDCQDIVKAMFNDVEMREKLNLAAVNSINWARIMSQIVYYVYSATRVGVPDNKVSFSVPTGNFGNVLAGYFAMRMGLPVDQFMVASNSNDILARYFVSKDMSMKQVIETHSPSMDIQVSSNFERLAFEYLGRDSEKLTATLEEFRSTGTMPSPDGMYEKICEKFQGFALDNDGTLKAIKKWYEKTGEVFDPHSVIGVEAGVAMKSNSPVVCMATAHPAKFPDAIEQAISVTVDLPDHMAGLFDRKEEYDIIDNNYKAVTDYVIERQR